jgi:hypothetical protein
MENFCRQESERKIQNEGKLENEILIFFFFTRAK